MLTAIVRWSLHHRPAVILLWGALLVAGLVAAERADLDAFPDFSPPRVSVQTEATGYSAEDVETFVTAPLEAAVGGTPGLETLRSRSVPGLSVLEIIFREGTEIHLARQLVAERLLRAQPLLPDGVEAPALEALSSATGRLLVIGLTSKESSPLELRAAVERVLRPKILSVPGVASATVFGGGQERVEVCARPFELARRGITWDDLVDTTKRASQVAPAGWVDGSSQRLHFIVDGRAHDPDELAETPVRVLADGTRVLLGDVAFVRSAAAPRAGDALIGVHGGKCEAGVTVVVEKLPTANALSATLAVEKAVRDVVPLLPPGTIVRPDLFRQATYVERSVTNLRNALLVGALIVVVTLLLFLGDWRASLISALAIPLSLLAAVLVLVTWGATVNAMTLGGLAIAIGEVVDDAIIDVENVARRLRLARETLGADLPFSRKLDLVLDASIEVRGAVVYATFVVAIAFLPLLFMGGLHGKLFAPLGVAYLASIAASLACAITLTPVLALLLLGGRAHKKEETRLARTLKRVYAALLNPILERPKAVVAVVLALLAFAGVAVAGFGGKLLPDLNEGSFTLQVATLPGVSLDASRDMARRASDAVLTVPGVRAIGTQIGRAELSEDTWDVENLEATVPLLEDVSPEEVNPKLAAVLGEIPGIYCSTKTYLTERVEEVISGETAALAVKIYGTDLDALDGYSAKVAQAITAVGGARSVRRLPSVAGPPALRTRVRVKRAKLVGLGSGEVAARVAAMLRGVTVGRVPSRALGADVVVRLEEGIMRKGREGLATLPISVPSGGTVPLASVADFDYVQARPAIFREGSVRRVVVNADVRGSDPATFLRNAQAAVKKLGPLPPGVAKIEWAGEEAERSAASIDIALKGLLATIVAFIVLQSALGSARLAGLVLTNLPFALVGGVAAVWLSGGVLTLGAYVGFVTIFGIASRNGVLLVAHLDHLVVREGCAWGRETVLRAAQERLVPIIMTASTAALGLLPIAARGESAGHEIEMPMALVIFGGLFTSTALSLLVLPTLTLRFGRPAASASTQI
jgi:CzcA family heavy metal efflux pump